MRYGSHNRYTSPRSSQSSLIRWSIIGVCILGGIFLAKTFLSGGEKVQDPQSLTLSGSGNIVITDSEWAKRDVMWPDWLSPNDSMLSVISGNALLEKTGFKIWVDKSSDVAYKWTASGNLSFEVMKWRSWIEWENDLTIKLKHFEASLPGKTVILMEQQRIHSILYVLRWSAHISASGKDYTLYAGNRIMVSQSDLANPGVELSKLTGKIDESIQQNSFFLARGGQELLANTLSTASSGSINPLASFSGASSSGTIIGWIALSGKYITITHPIDGSVVPGSSFKVEGSVLSSWVKKILINDKEVLIDAKTNSFRLDNVPLLTDTLDIVYKALDSSSNVVEKWVLTVYSAEKKSWTDKLIPTTFPTSDKTFRVLSPTENPYKTSNNSVTVSGSVPKNTVEYITVNDFRLKKYIANSTSWYYYANTAYATMKEGFNLYEIKFYGPNDTLLSTQLFTIIKEWDSPTLSWE